MDGIIGCMNDLTWSLKMILFNDDRKKNMVEKSSSGSKQE